MYSVEDVLRKLRARARPSQLEGMARYGIAVEKRLGVSIPDLRKIAKESAKTIGLRWSCGRQELMTLGF